MASTARIDELKKKFDENPRRYFAPLANEFRKAGDIEQAIIICEEFLPQQPGHMSGHIVYGQALYEASRMPEARTVFETALALDPENLIALRHLGDIARGQGDHVQARTWYVRVLDADPRNEEMQAVIASLEGESPAPAHPLPADDEAVTFEFQEEPAPAIELESRREASSATDSFRDTQPSGMPAVPPPIPSGGAALSGATEIIDGFSIEGFEQPPQATTVMESHHAPAEGLESTSFSPPDEPIPAADLDSTLDSGVVSFSAPTQQVASLSGLQGSGLDAHEEAGSAAATHEPLDLDDGLVLPPQGDPLAEQVQVAEAVEDLAEHPGDEFDVPATDSAALPSDADFDLAEPDAARDDAPPVELPPAVIAAEGALIDAGETPAPEPADDTAVESHELAEPAAQAPFVTETMADLYLSQGYRDDARAVYVQLLAANPSDGRLQMLVDSLAAPPAVTTGGPSVREFFARIAARRPGSRAAALVPPSNDDFAAHEMTAIAHAEPVEEPPEQAPFSVVEAQSEAEARDEGAADAPAGSAEPPLELLDVDVMEEEPAPAVEVVAPAIERAAAMRTPNGSIDLLFGNRPPSTSEDSAASALSQAFGGTAESPVLAGRPARAATAELSLDSVFRDGPARAPRTSQSFSFDQFFTGGAAASTQPTPSGGAPRTSGETPMPGDVPAERNAEDVEQFNSWLQGLKPK